MLKYIVYIRVRIQFETLNFSQTIPLRSHSYMRKSAQYQLHTIYIAMSVYIARTHDFSHGILCVIATARRCIATFCTKHTQKIFIIFDWN